MKRPEPSIRREFLAVFSLTVLGAGLRFWGYGRLGLNHFDEGIYALAGLWPFGPHGLAGLDPMVIPYSPPGFPFLVGLAYTVIGIADLSALLVSTVCGIATIPVAAWIGRRSFGVGAGAASAAFAALAMPHVAFSRKALTDVPFQLTWLIAIGLGSRFLEKKTLGRAVALGLAVGLAQQFKYNGWLTGVIVAGAVAPGLLWHPEERRSWIASGRLPLCPVLLSLIAAAVALLVYWPWFQFVERHGGYQALLAHHRSYLGGSARWYPYWEQQQAQVVALSGGTTWGAFSWSIAWLGAAWSRNGARLVDSWSRQAAARFTAGWLAGSGALAVLPCLPWWIGIAAAPWLLISAQPARRLLGSWWLLLSILTPCYHPYARLWLPLHAAGWFLLSGLLAELMPGRAGEAVVDSPNEGVTGRSRTRLRLVAVLTVLIVALAQQWRSPARAFPFASFFEGTAALREVATALPQLIPNTPGREANLIVFGRRPLSFYLLLQGRYSVRLAESLDDVVRESERWGIVDGALFDRGALADLPPGTAGRVRTIRHERLDPVTLLDISSNAAVSREARRTVSILLLGPGER